jgi:phenylpropionate dioxygenase-like ring-hydroxylating dioxygenase large terminal subunit
MTGLDESYLTDFWYLALPGRALKPRTTVGREFMGMPILIGRDCGGAVFAFQDLCPHRGVQLSKGRFDGERVSCPFHGWQFGTDGGCRAIPSLVDEKSIDVTKISVRRFPVVEHQGAIWIFLSDAPPSPDADLGTPPRIPEVGELQPRVATTLLFETNIDNAIYGLLDVNSVMS